MGNWLYAAAGAAVGAGVAIAYTIKGKGRREENGDEQERNLDSLLGEQYVCDELSFAPLKEWIKTEAAKCTQKPVCMLFRPTKDNVDLLELADGEMLDAEHYIIQIMYDAPDHAEKNDEIITERIVSMRFINFNTMSAKLRLAFGEQKMMKILC